MATDRRRAVATASTGAGLTVAGGVLRQQGLTAAHGGKHPPAFEWRRPVSTHQTRALLRTGARGRKRYLLGATLGLVGAPALAVGIHDSITRKRDDRRSFVNEGLRGTQDALEQRAESIKEVPPQHKAGPLTVSAGTGLVGSLGAHRGLDRLKSFRGARHSARAGITALTGTTLAGASYPLARHTVRSNDYEVTPAGVRRRKKPLVRPSAKSSRTPVRHRSLQSDLQKRYLGNGAWTVPKSKLGRGTLGPTHQVDIHTLDNQMKNDTHFGGMKRYNKTVRIKSGMLVSTRTVDPSDVYQRVRRGEAAKRAIQLVRVTPDSGHWASESTRKPMDDPGGYEALRIQQAIRPHTRAERAIRQKRDSRGRFTKAAKDYSGRRTATSAQRAAILAAGSTPIIGGIAGARTAGHFAPPRQRAKTETRQYGLTAAGSIAGGVAGAYGTAALASRHAGVARATERAAAAHGRASAKVRNLKPVNAAMSRLPKGGRTAARVVRTKETARGLKLARPLMRAPIAAGVGYVAGKTIGGYAGSGLAMRRNQADQREYNLKHPVIKYVENMTAAERRKLSRKKRYAAGSSTATGVLGLGALGARAKGRPDLALNLLTGSAAIGGVNNLNFAGVLRREAKATDPRRPHEKAASLGGVLVAKADHREPLTRMHADQAAELVRRHGDAGPLPSNLSRSERMQAYEARYVHAGGHKAEHWQRRADRADKVKVAGLAGATAGGAAIMALRSPRLAARLGQRAHAARHAADSATIGAATVSGAGELYAGHARRRRASYSSSKAGVAASALRRMKDYAA